ncbi:MAG TPA: pectate lyase [Bacteroidales bacterium]
MNTNFLRGLILTCLIVFVLQPLSFAQKQENNQSALIDTTPFYSSTHHWYDIHDKSNIINPKTNQPKYRAAEISKIADNILIYQRNDGGWPKNYDMQAILTVDQKDSLINTKADDHTTFDNTTTYSHIEYLAQAYTITGNEKYKDACLKGIDFTLAAQYPNGGWPQYYPLEDNYSRCITFNDGVFTGIMTMLKNIIDRKPYYSFVDDARLSKIKTAFDKGLGCILKCQIYENGRLTVWGQQHNEITLEPAWARAFEPPCICNLESADLVLFLMSLDNPNQQLINSIQGAVKWFNDSKILGTRVKVISAPDLVSQWRTSKTDRIVVHDPAAPPIWTRYYELKTEKPLFCDRNSKFLYSLSDVSRERRSGYNWYTYNPQQVLDSYPEWQKKWAPGKNVLNAN